MIHPGTASKTPDGKASRAKTSNEPVGAQPGDEMVITGGKD